MELQNIAFLINQHHQTATGNAITAVKHAEAAGQLLLQVKEGLPHGQFTNWIKANLRVSPRQCQRYMDVALGKPIPIRKLAGKYDTVSLLFNPNDQGKVISGKWIPNSGFEYCYPTVGAAYWVTPDSKGQGFHVSKHYQIERDPNVDPKIYADPDDPYDEREWDGMSVYDGTKYPMRADMIDPYLRHISGLADPSKVQWKSWPSKGRNRPFGEPAAAGYQR